jgi:hypothetical protein
VTLYVLLELEHPTARRAKRAMLHDGPNWDGDWESRYFPGCNPESVQAHRVDFDMTPQGIRYYWQLSGPGGAWFLLFPEPHHSTEQAKQARNHLRNSRDVTGMRTVRVPKLHHYATLQDAATTGSEELDAAFDMLDSLTRKAQP